MRILLSRDSKRKLLEFLKKKNKVNSLSRLSKELKVPRKTLDDWFYNCNRYIPEKIIPTDFNKELKILDKKEDNWGSVIGGKKTYKIILKKYGTEEIRKRQSKGGRKSFEKKDLNLKKLEIDIKNPLFLEFYGILLGDGWISKIKYKNKITNLIGISGHIKLDKDFFNYLQKNIKKLFDRKAYLKKIPKRNTAELLFSHKIFLNFLSSELNFPVGKKINLEIHSKISNLPFINLKHVIRGIFDTDGSFYLDKTPVGNNYPCISIEMKAPKLIKQLDTILKEQGFKVSYRTLNGNRRDKSRITLKGRKQINKWMEEIGSSNRKHLDKINALVAQSG